MGTRNEWLLGLLVLLCCAISALSAVDCETVTSLMAPCSNFTSYGTPKPLAGSPCCGAVLSLNNIAVTLDNRQSVCRCLMDLITTYNPNVTAIATLPDLCGISLGFTLDPDTDCSGIPGA